MHGLWGCSWRLLSFVHPQVITSPSGKWLKSGRRTSTATRKMFPTASTAAGTRLRRSTHPPSLPPWRTWAPSTGGRASTRPQRPSRTAPSDRGKRSASAQISVKKFAHLHYLQSTYTTYQLCTKNVQKRWFSNSTAYNRFFLVFQWPFNLFSKVYVTLKGNAA